MQASASSIQRALIVIDMQNEYLSGNLPIEYPDPQRALANVVAAMDAAHAAQIPIVVIQQTVPPGSALFAQGSEGWQLHPEVARRPRTHWLQKTLPSPFPETDLADWLRAQQVDTLTVVGFMTHNCDASTINHALHMGLNVEFLHDASGTVSYQNQMGLARAEDIHRVFCVVLQSRFAAVLSTQQWLACLARGTLPERDSIYQSNQRARGLL